MLLLSDIKQLSVCLECAGMSKTIEIRLILSCRKIKIGASFPGSAAVGCEAILIPPCSLFAVYTAKTGEVL